MAASSSSAVILLLLLLAATVSARPCKTIFYFNYPQIDQNYIPGNLNPNFRLQMRKPQFELLTLVFTTTSSSQLPQHLNLDPSFDPISLSSSIRDRSRDVLSVVGALLFGVGCGTLTGAALYLVWALLCQRRVDFNDDGCCYSSEDDDDEVVVARKLGYVAIPVSGDDGDEDLRKPMLLSKEVGV